jgi:phage FluMu gp28-like protein
MLGAVDIFHAMDHWFSFKPHPAQEKIIRGMKKTTTIVAGRRFGKSKLMAALALHFALTNRRTTQYVVSHSDDQARIIFNDLRNMALESPMVSKLITAVKDFPFAQISFKSGSEIHARSTGNNEGKYLRGHSAHRVIIDEAAYVKENVINTVISPMLADYADHGGGWLIKISTPMGKNHFYESYQQGVRGEPECASFQFTSFDNPHISHRYIQRERAKITDLQYRVEYLAEFVDEQVAVFRWDSINDAMGDMEELYASQKGRNYYIGVDVAKVHDYTSITVIDGTDQKDCRVVYTERFTNRPYSYVVERILGVCLQFQPLRVLIDETGVGAGITEQVALQVPASEGFVFSMQSKIGLINTLKTGLEQRRIKFSASNTVLSEELRYYEYDINEDTGTVKMNAAHGKHDDCVISLALAYQKCAVIYADVEVSLIDAQSKQLNTSGESASMLQGTERQSDDVITVI